jgi:hypothetical protein
MQSALKSPILTAAVLMATALSAQADYYDAGAALTFTLISIVNSDGNPNDLSALAVSMSYQQPTDANNFYVSASGDGAYNANNPSITNAPLSSNPYIYSVSATAANGSVTTYNNGYYTLDFNNTSSSNSYTVDLTLSYVLTADAGGASLSAASSAELNYSYSGSTYVANSNFSGFDYVFTNALYPSYTADSESQPGSAELVFTLAPGENETFNANPVLSGYLVAVTAVPVPASIWLFGSAMLGFLGAPFGFNRRKTFEQ